jgi:hypothetical protein
MTTTETSAPAADFNRRVAIETLLALGARAYEGDPTHSLLANLRAVRDADWTLAPPGGGRAIAEIVEHVGWSKWMYRDRAFGAGTLRGDAPPIIPEGGVKARPQPELLAWLDDGHRQWVAAIRSLSDDADLQRICLTAWDDHLPLSNLIHILIAHDFYHAGEINHIRALLDGSDRWPY